MSKLADELEALATRDGRNPNTGHGHVYPRPDGNKVRCGGPHMCSECALDFVRKNSDHPVSIPASLVGAIIAALRATPEGEKP